MIDLIERDANRNRRINDVRRIVCCIILMVVSFGQNIIGSFQVVVHHIHIAQLSRPSAQVFVQGIVEDAFCLAVMWLMLRIQYRGVRDIGLDRLRWTDWGVAIAIIAVAEFCQFLVIVGYVWVSMVTHHQVQARPMNVGFLSVHHQPWLMWVLGIVAVIMNGFNEDLIVRAYFMTDLNFFTRRPWVAVVCSTLLQDSYHFYQGVAPAVTYLAVFLVMSLYFQKTRRIWPIVIAHIIVDTISLIQN